MPRDHTNSNGKTPADAAWLWQSGDGLPLSARKRTRWAGRAPTLQTFVASGSSVAACEADSLSVLNGVDAIYRADVGVTYEVTTIIVRTAEPDPYAASLAGGTLNQCTAEWIPNQAGIQRDVVHLFLGKMFTNQVAGLANLSAVCNESIGYGLVQTFATAVFATRVALSAPRLHQRHHVVRRLAGLPRGSVGPARDRRLQPLGSSAGVVRGQCEAPLHPRIGLCEHVRSSGRRVRSREPVPAGFEVVTDSQIDVALPLLPALGQTTVTVTNPAGSDAASIEIVPDASPALQLGAGGEPETLFSFFPVELTVGGLPGSAHFIWASTSLAPTSVPGTFDLDIGAGFTDLFLAGLPVVEEQGWAELSIVGAVVPPSTTLYFQSFEYDPITQTLPAPASNVAVGFWLF